MWCRLRRMLRGMGRWLARRGRWWRRVIDLRVESVALSRWSQGTVRGAVFRVTISAGPYVIRDMPAIVSVDGVPVGIGAESVDLASLVVWTHD